THYRSFDGLHTSHSYKRSSSHINTIVEFTYERKLVDQPNKLFWKAITKDGRKIIVKFTWDYNQRAHKLCSEIGKAPKLLYINKEVVDGFYIVVMDYVEAEQLYECNSLSHDEYKAVFKDIKEAIDKLHEENIVFADLREVMRYPSFMNHKHINWPPVAEDRKKLCRKHDVYWLELLKSKYLGESVEKTKLRQELKARTDELKETISHYSVEIGKLNGIIVELEKNKTVIAKLESENAEFRDRITKVEQRQMLSDNVSKVTNSSNNSSSNFNLLADQLPMEMDTSLPEESIPEGLPEPAVNIPVMDQ
ncbi:10609_t:CDS:2, partial [Racocetra persica]